MPLARNALDACAVYFEDDGGDGPPVVIMGGFGRSTVATRAWGLATALEEGHRRIFVDHRGHGKSGKPRKLDDYSIQRRSTDVVAVLDELGLDSAHYVGTSWGARLGFGLGELAGERLRSLTLGGQMPYAMKPDGPVVAALSGAMGSEARRARFVERLRGEDVVEGSGRELADALSLAWTRALGEGDIAMDLVSWTVPTLIYAGTEDKDFFDGARRAATEIPSASFVALQGFDHFETHGHVEGIAPEVRRHIGEAEEKRR